jgi:hypothetical protein
MGQDHLAGFSSWWRRKSEEDAIMSEPTLDGPGVALLSGEIYSGHEALPVEKCLEIHRIMVRSRAMEERMIKMSKSGQGYFWIGGPGEEGFNTCLGLQVKKGQGPDYDYLHLHYRNSSTLVAMGMPLSHGLRQMAMTATDSHSMGRNFSSHFAHAPWNVIPVSSVIEVQYVMAPGTALMQKRRSQDAITIVTGGDAGTAEGDFASCMVWSTRPGNELPVLMVVTNNGWGISTPACSQHGGLRHARGGRRWQRSHRQLVCHSAGHGICPAHAAALYSRSHGIAPLWPFLFERRSPQCRRAGSDHAV